ncbi:hypothetical protein LR48_Vigan04g203600 [Vigna angularis]|uniref:Uncharacterized protein n=1 Tax=Phaseolus angularis TaxID=3914 RepID=A0A0L9UGF5_PHAAN|nr:hypothetical protein LR48_Vigan04g203600 [Vigna angularis]
MELRVWQEEKGSKPHQAQGLLTLIRNPLGVPPTLSHLCEQRRDPVTTPTAEATTVHDTRYISSFLSSRSLFLAAGQEHCRRQRQCWKRCRPPRPSSFRTLSFTRGTETQLRRDIIAVARHSTIVGTSATTGARCDATSGKECRRVSATSSSPARTSLHRTSHHQDAYQSSGASSRQTLTASVPSSSSQPEPNRCHRR